MKLADEVVRDAKYVQIGIGRRPGQEHHAHDRERAGRREDRVAGEVPAAHRRSGAGVRADEVGRRTARAQARRRSA